MPAVAVQAFYQVLEQTHQQTGRLDHSYHLVGYIAPAATLPIQDQIKRFRQDSLMRHICLQSGGGLQCGVASPFFSSFQRMQVDTSTLPMDTSVFGEPDEYCVVQTQSAFNALFRHFCYGLGNDLSLPPGAYYAGSSCVAAAKVPAGTSEIRLVQLEQRTQRKLEEPMMERTLSKKFPGKRSSTQPSCRSRGTHGHSAGSTRLLRRYSLAPTGVTAPKRNRREMRGSWR